MALTNLSQITTSGISTLADINLNNLTGVAATFTGNVTIGGTLTYDDVTNIDSVGIITARSGIRVLTGTATTALVVEGNARVTGILTVGTSSLTLNGSTNVVNVGTALTLGHTQGLQFHTQNLHSQGFDVNNVNATGIVTAHSGIDIVGGSKKLNFNSGASGVFEVYRESSGNAYIRATNQLRMYSGDRFSFSKIGGDTWLALETSGHTVTGNTNIIGNVGIGTDNPDEALHVYAAGGAIKVDSNGDSAVRWATSGTNKYSLYHNNGANALIFYDNGNNAERIRLTSAGSIGIGTDNPGTKLDVRGGNWSNGDIVVGQSGNAGRIKFRRGADGSDSAFIGFAAADNNSRLSIGVDSGDGTIAFQTNSTERLRIDSSGRVLQGLTSAKFGFFNDNNAPPVFQIQGSTYYDSAFSIFRDGTGASGPNFILAKGREAIVQDNDTLGTISFQGHDGTTELIEGASIVTEVDGTPAANDVPSALIFKTNSGTSSTSERLRIDSDGAVNIGHNPAQSTGTNTQNAILTVKGYPGGNESSAAILALIRGYNTTSAAANHTLGRIVFGDKQAGEYAFIEGEAEANGAVGDTPGRLVFSTAPDNTSAPTERLRITSAGNVNINTGDLNVGETTDSNAGSQTISVGSITSGAGGIQLWGNPTNGNSYIQFGDAEAGSSHYRGYINYRHANDSLRFGAAGSDRFIIDSEGRVTIMQGTSTANYNNKLMVLGSGTNTSTGTGSYVVMGVGDTNSQQSGRGGGIAFHGNDGVNTQVTLATIQGFKENSVSGDYSGGWRVLTRVNQGVLTERLRVTGQGHFSTRSVIGTDHVIADFQEGSTGTDSRAYVSITTGYSSGSNEGSARMGVQRTGNGNAADWFVSTRANGTNISTGWTQPFTVHHNAQIRIKNSTNVAYSNADGSTSMYHFRLPISMVGNVAYTIRLRGYTNGATHVRLMGSHWTSPYHLVKESYFYTDVYAGLSETSVHNISSSAQGAWSVSRPTSGQTGYQTDMIITKSAGSYGGGHQGMIDILSNSNLYLVSIT